MTQKERQNLERDYALFLWLLDYYATNKEAAKSMTNKEYQEYLDEILDEINRIKKLLEEAEN